MSGYEWTSGKNNATEDGKLQSNLFFLCVCVMSTWILTRATRIQKTRRAWERGRNCILECLHDKNEGNMHYWGYNLSTLSPPRQTRTPNQIQFIPFFGSLHLNINRTQYNLMCAETQTLVCSDEEQDNILDLIWKLTQAFATPIHISISILSCKRIQSPLRVLSATVLGEKWDYSHPHILTPSLPYL